jgi:hypothetical protein
MQLLLYDIDFPVIEISSFYGAQQSVSISYREDGNRSTFRNVVFSSLTTATVELTRAQI